MSTEQLVLSKDCPLQVLMWLNNTQAVERGIKAVTEAATAVTGKDPKIMPLQTIPYGLKYEIQQYH
jgi:hypothetical protein